MAPDTGELFRCSIYSYERHTFSALHWHSCAAWTWAGYLCQRCVAVQLGHINYVRNICLMASAHWSHGLSMTWRSVESGLAERRSWSNSLIWLIFVREKFFHTWFFQLKSRACRLQY